MLHIERCKPVAQLIEEREALHLRESAEVDVRPCFLHVHHLAELLLRFLNVAVCGVGVHDVVHRVVFLLLYSETRHLEVAVLQERGHYVFAYFVVVGIGIATEQHLQLQFKQLFAHRPVCQHGLQSVLHIAKQFCLPFRGQGKHPSDERSLSQLFRRRAAEHVGKHKPLVRVKHIHRRQHDCTDNQHGIGNVDGRRDQQFGVVAAERLVPHARCHHSVKQRLHVRMVGGA